MDGVIELIQQIRSGDRQTAESAKCRLIEAHLRLVVSIAERHREQAVSILDLIQTGNEALLRALDSFTATSGESFSAYATTCIKRAMKSAGVG